MTVAHSLPRIKSMLVNTPLLVDQNTFNTVIDYVNSRMEGAAEIKPEMANREDVQGDYKGRYVDAAKTGVMDISGPLTYKTSGWEAMCGGTSYEMLKGQMEYFVSQGAKTVAMYVDSGGGQAHGMMDSANYVRQLADKNGIKIIAFVDGMSASAAYGFTSIADEVVMTHDSQVGSIGVLIQLMNNSKALEKQGYERTFITAGKDKVPFDKDGSFTDAFLEGLQEQVDILYEGFTSHVADHRGLSVDAVKGTEANVFMAKEAIELGLADKIMTAEEFNEYLSVQAMTNASQGDSVKNPFKFDKTTQEDTEMNVAELTDALAKATAQLEANSAAMAGHAEAVSGLQAQLTGVQTELQAAKDALAAAEKASAEAKLEQRKAALSEVLPADQVDAKLTAFASLDEATFSFMVSELQAAKDVRAASFKAIGEDGAEEEAEEVTPEASLLAKGKEAAKRFGR